MRRYGFKGFVFLGKQEVMRTFGALKYFETKISRFLDRTCSIDRSSSQECGLLAMLHCNKNQELRQLGWINQFTTFLS